MKTQFYRLILALSLVLAIAAGARAAELELEQGDRICLVGNALGERMQHHNHWETLLYQRFLQHELAVRNLCFPGDEPLNRLRSLNFGDPDAHLAHSKASVILFFFGFNESFHGDAGIGAFVADLTKLVQETKTKNYSGDGPPKMVLVSPIAFENTGDRNLPDGKEHNERLARYSHAMQQVARETGVGFADLYTPTKELFESTEARLTLDGAHLNDLGYQRLAPILDRALFGANGAPKPADEKTLSLLKAEIDDKNFHWWHRYRAVNGYSIYGTRGEAGSDGTYRNREVMERERAILDQMCANRDARIWKLAQGQEVSPAADDSNTLPFINPKTNVGGADDPNRKAGKLGSLDYLPAAEQQKLFKLAPGYQIDLFASEEDFPELANPVALNFDSQGRLWVSTMPSYPQWRPKTKLDDKLLILEDLDRDGRADRCKVFAGGLHQPTGFEIGMGGVYIAQQPDILFLQDADGDDRADVRIRRLVGFDTADSHHGLAAFEWGPDGGLYFQEGTFKQSQVESPYGLTRLGDAGIWRFHPRTCEFEVHSSLAFANPWGHVFDRWGQNFIADASPGYNYWAAPISGFVRHPDKHPGGTRAGHLDFGGSTIKKDFPTFINKRIRPSSGCEIVSSRNFPPEAQGNFLLNNVIGERAVLQHKVREEGSGYVGEEIETLVAGEDGNFRPVDLQFGPDGALYIVDWHNALIGHLQHNLREPHRDHSHGRIWRVRYTGRPLVEPPQIAGAPIDALLKLLDEPEDRTRYRARRELAQRETADVIAATEKWLASLDPSDADHQRRLLEGLWIHKTHNVVNEQLLRQLLGSPDYRARAAATRVLTFWRDRVASTLELLRQRIDDPHPRVRLEAVRACSFLRTPEAIEAALDVLDHEMDEYLEYTLFETVRVVEDELHAAHTRLVRADQSDHAAHADHQHHAAGHDHGAVEVVAPIVFLDKSENIVAYQLDRLTNAQLLAIPRSPNDARFRPVCEAILLRAGMSRQDREAALAELAALGRGHAASLLLGAIGRVDPVQKGAGGVVKQLSAMLLGQPPADLAQHKQQLHQALRSRNKSVRAAAFAALVISGDQDIAFDVASQSPEGRADFLAGIPLIEDEAVRASLRDKAVSCLDASQAEAVRRAAVVALAFIPSGQAENFHLAAKHVAAPEFRAAAVQTLSAIGRQYRSADDARRVVEALVKHAEETPPAQRTTGEFLDAMNLADELIALLPIEEARQMRGRLRETTVRVVKIGTVQEEMRYDTSYFAVEAGRPVQLVLHNDDLMPHNLLITAPGAMREVAELAATLPPVADRQGRQYVPESDKVLFAMPTVQSNRQEVLTFTAPTAPGEYPYVCTFPQHWTRMYGVMVVVDDLDAWLADPQKPADPLGLNRDFVQNWKYEDLKDELSAGLRGRTPEIGQRIFQEATCAQCHKIKDAGGAVGPELTGVLQRWKGDRQAVLREILDPAHKVDPQFALYNLLLADGRVISGIVTAQDRDSVTVVSNPEKPLPEEFLRDDIDEMIKTSTSLMPKGLLDRFTQDEIFELVAYIISAQGAEAASGGAQ